MEITSVKGYINSSKNVVTFGVKLTGDWNGNNDVKTKEQILDLLFKNEKFLTIRENARRCRQRAWINARNNKIISKFLPIPLNYEDWESVVIESGTADFSMTRN